MQDRARGLLASSTTLHPDEAMQYNAGTSNERHAHDRACASSSLQQDRATACCGCTTARRRCTFSATPVPAAVVQDTAVSECQLSPVHMEQRQRGHKSSIRSNRHVQVRMRCHWCKCRRHSDPMRAGGPAVAMHEQRIQHFRNHFRHSGLGLGERGVGGVHEWRSRS